MTSFDDTPFEDKIAKAVKRRFWLTKAALGRPEIKQEEKIFKNQGMLPVFCWHRLLHDSAKSKAHMQPLRYQWFQKCKCKQLDIWMWCVIWGIEGAQRLMPLPLYERSSQFLVCRSVCSSEGRWRPAQSVKAAHPPPPPLALQRERNYIHDNSIYV